MSKPIVLQYLHLDDRGGGPKIVALYLQHLAANYEVHLALAGEANLTDWCNRNDWVVVHRIPEYAPWLCFLTVFRLILLLRRLGPAAVITHGQWGGALMGCALPFSPNCGSAYVVHWCALYHMTDPFRAARNFVAEWLAVKAHREVVCLSEGNLRQYLYARLLRDRDRVSIIPNPVEISSTPESQLSIETESAPTVNGVLTFLFLGRLEEQKRPDWLLRAWRKALDLGLRNARLVLLGEGNLRSELEKMIHLLQLSDTVSLLGYQPDPQKYLRSCDAVLVTSLFEGHAGVPLEAMAAGKPVIAMSADGVQESFQGEEGILVPLGDVESLAHAIFRVAMNSSLREKMGSAGACRVSAFSMSTHRTSCLGLARRLLASNL